MSVVSNGIFHVKRSPERRISANSEVEPLESWLRNSEIE